MAVKKHHAISTGRIDDGQHGDEGALEMAHFLASNTSLQELRSSRNLVTPHAAESLAVDSMPSSSDSSSWLLVPITYSQVEELGMELPKHHMDQRRCSILHHPRLRSTEELTGSRLKNEDVYNL